ncbi:MAG: hypothetical protein CMI17_03555 [Opitutaceae bacterium]|jgi:hypothetical protein|nr:hypothetical protein [Opitutaceae bacterium]|tara:strand:+ start:1764 stop:1952 length:189 start_codon:yes stop_codon:yes gene_type:complete
MPDPKFSEIEPKKNRGLIREFLSFALHSKKYWLIPLVGILFLFGILIFLSGTSAAPFIYSLF